MANYRPGELDKRITIKREVETPNRSGGFDLSLVDVATIWAHVRPKSGNEFTSETRVNASVSYLFVIRFRNDLRPSDHIIWNGVSFNIRAILTRGGRDLYLEIDAENGVAQ